MGDLLLLAGGASAVTALPFAVFGCWGLTTATRYGSGGPGTRLSTQLYTPSVAALGVLLSSALPWMYGAGLRPALAAFVLLAAGEAGEWFDGRPY
ncbi:hypothetical protein [Streptomyces sp. NPDC088925]|uniref:hypothetical protein n=1 Tax=Streptomyces sp. NPDC088925 TaxID=3365914 RepID=UPI0038099AEB